jgi:hypothetical protein
MEFYKERLSAEDIGNLTKTCSAFVNDYMGKNLVEQETEMLDEMIDEYTDPKDPS